MDDSRFSVLVEAGGGLLVRASGAAGLGARAESLVHDGLDGAGAAAALGAAAQTSIHLPGRARGHRRSTHGISDVVIGEYVAGTHDHGDRQLAADVASWIFNRDAGCKRKNRLLKLFQIGGPRPIVNAAQHGP